MQHHRAALVDHAVAGVGAALIPGNRVRLGAQGIDDLALALIAPLGAHHHGARHEASRCGKTRGTLAEGWEGNKRRADERAR